MSTKKIYAVGGDLPQSEEQIQKLKEREEAQEQASVNLPQAVVEKKLRVAPTSVRLRPHEDRVIIYPDQAPEKTESGIYIPETAEEKFRPATGTVIRVGEGKDGKTINLKPGDRVMFGRRAGTPIINPDDKDCELLVMRYADTYITIEEA